MSATQVAQADHGRDVERPGGTIIAARSAWGIINEQRRARGDL